MFKFRTMLGVLLAAMLITASFATKAQRLANGNDWKKSTTEVRLAYLAGISDMLTVGYAYDSKKLPEQESTFMRQSFKGLSDTTTPEAMDRIDAWYKANPGQLDKPILSVIWIDIAKPRLVSSK